MEENVDETTINLGMNDESCGMTGIGFLDAGTSYGPCVYEKGHDGPHRGANAVSWVGPETFKPITAETWKNRHGDDPKV